MLDQVQVDGRSEPNEQEQAAEGLPLGRTVLVVVPEPEEGSEEQQETVTANGEWSLAAPDHPNLPGPSAESQDREQPPDLTSTIAHSQADAAVLLTEGEKEQRPADILDQVPLTDRPLQTDSQGPSKPPRQFTVEPDIVASTKKPPPTRPPPPGGGPPPRPPPPSCRSLPSRMSQECMRPSGLEGEKTLDDSHH